MYRIRLQSGEEAVYKTVEELAAAVTSGMISPTAEVFHKAGNRWLPINTHPDYRAVITAKRQALQQQTAKELQQASSSGVPAEQSQSPVRSPTRKSQPAVQFEVIAPAAPPPAPEPSAPPATPTVKSAKIVAPEPIPEEVTKVELEPTQPGADPFPELAPEGEIVMIEPPAPAEEPQPETDIEAVLPPGIHRPKPPVIPIVLGVTGLLVAAGIAAVLFTRRPAPQTPPSLMPPEDQSRDPAPAPVAVVDSHSAKPAPPTPKDGSSRPTIENPRLARPDTVAVVYPAPSKPLIPGTKAPAPSASAPASRTVSRLGTTVTKLPSYYEAYADARAEMDEALGYVDFRSVFAAYRFASPDSIRATRRMVAAAGNILRVYRGREVMLEQTYRPGEPEGKGSLRETFEVAEASRGLLADVDSLFVILVGQEGEVKYRDSALSFRNSRAAQAYANIRRQVMQTLTYLGDPAEAADRVTMPRLLRGFGTDRPPPAR
jgi:hypothetical protein